MSILLVIICSFAFIVISRLFFEYRFNHLAIYTFVWGGMIFLYELKFLKYTPLTDEAWFVIILTYLIFFIGAITPIFIRESKKTTDSESGKNNSLVFFVDDGRALKTAIYILGSISLLSAFHNWYILLNKYGNFLNIFLSANEIYRMTVDDRIPGAIPYLGAISLSGIFLAGIYTAYKSKFTLPVFITILGAVLRDLSIFARIGILVSIIIFFLSFFLYRNYIKRFIVIKKTKLIAGFLIAIILIVSAASAVRIFRGSYESYKIASKEISTLRTGLIITPSVYLYLSAHIGVFSKYLDKDIENPKFGENTFKPFYNFLEKFDLAERVGAHQKGYLIPMWTNSSTYLRELHSDFGFLGVFTFPYLLAFLTTVFWRKFYSQGNIFVFMFLVFLSSIVAFSFFSLIIRGPDWYFAFIILGISLPVIKASALRNKKKGLTSNNII